jgi:prepilin-type N-terminal cleavage/methylation domain-containing protein
MTTRAISQAHFWVSERIKGTVMCEYELGARRTTDSRPGYTFVELLVVIAIVALLVGLTAAVAFGVMTYQRNSNTETELRTLDGALDQQWQTVIKQASKETINPLTLNRLLAMAAGNNAEKRARLIWVKLRLKQEFPMNFSEVANGPLSTPAGSGFLMSTDLSTKGTYASYFSSFTNPGISSSSNPSPYGWPTESSVTLLMALKVGRSGNTFTEDLLPASAVTPTNQNQAAGAPLLQGLPILIDPATGQPWPSQPPIPGPKQIVDAWGNPLVFYRWPAPYVGDTTTDDLNVDSSSPAGSAPSASLPFRDPLDPEGLLSDPTWNSFVNFSNQQGVYWFEQLLHPVHQGSTAATYAPASYFMRPVIVSAGKDGALGLVQPGVSPSPLLPDNMDVDTTQSTRYDQDNIYSYRLR